MTLTPWGDASQLRARKLAPGYRLPPASVARNQRWRLLAAMVATVAEQGYDRTTVSDVVEMSGVSRTAFYRHFANREECLVTAVDETLRFALAAISAGYRRGDSRGDPLTGALAALVDEVVAQPAAARVCFLEVYVAGDTAIEHADMGAAELGRMIAGELERSPAHAGLPPTVVSGIVGGVRNVIFKRLRLRQEPQLPALVPDLAAWARSYEAPGVPLRRPRARPPVDGAPSFVEHDQVERIFAALAAVVREKGYWSMTLDDVAERASTSFSTFYSHFRTKEDAFLSAYDAGLAQAYAAALPAFQRAPDWPHAVRAALAALLAYLAREPNWAHAGIVEVRATGWRGMERRDDAVATFTALLEPGYELAPDAPPVAGEAIGGAIFELLYGEIRKRGADRLPELLPLTTFMALAPFLGADVAAAVANERAPRRERAGGRR